MSDDMDPIDGGDPMQAALSSLGASARATNLARAERIDEALTDLESGTLSAERREVAMRSAHQLAGSAGTFGLQPASGLARWFEGFFAQLVSSSPGIEPRVLVNGDLAAARHRLRELRSRLNDPPELS